MSSLFRPFSCHFMISPLLSSMLYKMTSTLCLLFSVSTLFCYYLSSFFLSHLSFSPSLSLTMCFSLFFQSSSFFSFLALFSLSCFSYLHTSSSCVPLSLILSSPLLSPVMLTLNPMTWADSRCFLCSLLDMRIQMSNSRYRDGTHLLMASRLRRPLARCGCCMRDRPVFRSPACSPGVKNGSYSRWLLPIDFKSKIMFVTSRGLF